MDPGQIQIGDISSKKSKFSVRPCFIHIVSLGTSSATDRRSSVASFRYTPVEEAERWPSRSLIDLSGTFARNKLVARA
jgi:hypothetical protein